MIKRFPGLTPTRSRAVVHDALCSRAVAPDPVTTSMYEQSVKALARIDESLALCGSHKSKILSPSSTSRTSGEKSEMNRAWMNGRRQSSPMRPASVRSGAAAHRGDRVTAAK